MHSTQNTKRIKNFMPLLLLCIPLTISCQENTVKEKTISISRDPDLLVYIRNYPTIRIDTSENVAVQRISYKNFEKKEISYGEEDPGTFFYRIFLFQNGVFQGIENVLTREGVPTRRYKNVDIIRDQNGVVTIIDDYLLGEDQVRHFTYKKDGNVTIANNGLRSGATSAVVIEEESKLLYFGSHKRYDNTPDTPDRIIEFINDKDVIVTEYNFLSESISSRFHFINGILMKEEHLSGGWIRTETYTVSSGIGEIIVSDPSGEVTERRKLERRLNAAGLLEYESVVSQTGRGYEYIFTKDTFN